jgi:hypothetical protein
MTPTTIMRRLALLCALALAALGAGAPAASAGESEWIDTKGGKVSFDHRGEWLMALDERPGDGYRVRAYIRWPVFGGLLQRAQVTDDPTIGSSGGPASFANLGIREGTNVELVLCYAHLSGQIAQCSRPQRAEA